jgi:hypothetical protein
VFDCFCPVTAACLSLSCHCCQQKRIHELIHESFILGGLLVLHRPNLMLTMCSTNLSNGQSCVAPLGHFHKVAQRLGLSQQQLSHLRLMLQQYNRSMHQQLQQGLGLLQVSKNIAGVQTAVVVAQARSEQSANSAAAATAAEAAAAADKGVTGNASANSSRDVLHGSGSSGIGAQRVSGAGEQNGSASEQQQQSSSSNNEEVDAEGLSSQLQQQLSERMQVMQVSAFAAAAAAAGVQQNA